MLNKINFLLFFFILAFTHNVFARGKVITINIAGFKIELSQDFDSGIGKFKIFKAKKVVFEEVGFEHHYYFGNQFTESNSEKDHYSGKKMFGTKQPNLVISNWTGGAHCCHFLHIFELGKNLKKISTISLGSSYVEIKDLDHDKIPELEFYDGSIDYQFASFAGSPKGRVVLQFVDGEFIVDKKLMFTDKPDLKLVTANLKNTFIDPTGPELPYEYLKTIIELSYAGHLESALKFAADVWPKDHPGFEVFKKDLLASLSRSIYFQKLYSQQVIQGL